MSANAFLQPGLGKIFSLSKVLTSPFKLRTRCVCEALMPPKHPSFEKHDPNI